MFSVFKDKNNNFIYFLSLFILNLFFLKVFFYTVGDLTSVNAGEFRNPVFPEIIFNKGLSLWDESVAFGFNNMYGANKPEYGIGQPIWIFNNLLDLIFKNILGIFLTTQYISLLVLNLTIFKIVNIYGKNFSKIQKFIFVFSVSIILYFSTMSFGVITSGAKYLLWQSLVLLSLILFKEIINNDKNYKFSLLYLFSSLYFLSLFFPPFFVVISFYILLFLTIDTFTNFFKGNYIDKKKLFLILIALGLSIILGQALSLIPILFESENINILLARHSIPLAHSTDQLLNLFNNLGDVITISWYLLIFIGCFGFFYQFKKFINKIDLFLFVIFLFLSHGSYSFFSKINIFIHQEIPFLNFLGSTYPYTSITASFLVIFFVLGIIKTINYFKLYSYQKYFIFLLLSLLTIFLSLNSNLHTSNIKHKVSSITFPKDYYDFKIKAEQMKLNTRMYYFPDNRAIVPSHYNYSDSTLYCCYSLPFINNFPIDTKWSNYNDWSGDYSSYLSFYNESINDSNDLIFFMHLTNTSHLIFDLNVKKDTKGYYRLKNILNLVVNSSLFQIDKSLSNKSIKVYELKVKNNFFERKKINLISPNLKAVKNTFDNEKLMNPFILSKNLPINKFYSLIDNNLIEKITGLNYDLESIFLDLISNDYNLEPKNDKKFGANNNWTYMNQFYRDVYVIKNSGNIFLNNKPSFSNHTSTPIIFDVDNPKEDEGFFFLRAYVSPNSGNLSVKTNNYEKTILLKSKNYEGFKWFKFESTDTSFFEASVQDSSKFYIIDTVLFISKNDYNNKLSTYKNKINNLQKEFYTDRKYDDWLTQEESNLYNSKNIIVNNEFFKFSENLDIFNDSKLVKGASIENDFSYTNTSFEREYNSSINGNFLKTVNNQTSEFNINIHSNGGFQKLSISVETLGFNSKLPLIIEIHNNYFRDKFILNEDKNHIFEISNNLLNKKNISIKIYTDNYIEEKVAYIKNINIEGQAIFYDRGHSSNFVDSKPQINDNLVILDNSFDQNWKLGKSVVLNMNLGNIGFLCPGSCKNNLSHKYTLIYKFIVFLNLFLLASLSLVLLYNLISRKKS